VKECREVKNDVGAFDPSLERAARAELPLHPADFRKCFGGIPTGQCANLVTFAKQAPENHPADNAGPTGHERSPYHHVLRSCPWSATGSPMRPYTVSVWAATRSSLNSRSALRRPASPIFARRAAFSSRAP